MELDELKKSWNALDKQLQKEPIADEQQIAKLIATHKANTRKSLNKLLSLQRFSIGFGILFIFLLATAFFYLPQSELSEYGQTKVTVFIIALAVTMTGALAWDWTSYLQSKKIRVNEMSVVEISRRTNTLRQTLKYEIVVVTIWQFLFLALCFWLFDLHLASFTIQIVWIAFCLLFDGIFLYLFYKKTACKYLNNMKQNIEELKDICTE